MGHSWKGRQRLGADVETGSLKWKGRHSVEVGGSPPPLEDVPMPRPGPRGRPTRPSEAASFFRRIHTGDTIIKMALASRERRQGYAVASSFSLS